MVGRCGGAALQVELVLRSCPDYGATLFDALLQLLEHLPPMLLALVLQAAAPMSQEGPCGGRVKEFADCMSRNNGDMQACNFYFEAMQACKTEAGYRV